MTKENVIQLFEEKQVRSVWDAEKEKWFFSIVDVVGILTESPNPRKYWSVLKTRLKTEESQVATNCSQLKMLSSDGKFKRQHEQHRINFEYARRGINKRYFGCNQSQKF